MSAFAGRPLGPRSAAHLDRQDLPRHDRGGKTGNEKGWVCATTAPNQLVAEMWQQAMREEGIPSMLASRDAVSFLGLTSTPVRLMVPAEMEERAHALLDGLLSSDVAPPDEDDR
jgi:hypothetical protein